MILSESVIIMDKMRREKFPFIATKEEQQALGMLIALGQSISDGTIKIVESDKKHTR